METVAPDCEIPAHGQNHNMDREMPEAVIIYYMSVKHFVVSGKNCPNVSEREAVPYVYYTG